MSATKEDIKAWLKYGTGIGATHVIVMLDTWDYENYPVYVKPQDNIHDKVASYEDGNDRLEEVYNLSMNIEEQLNTGRAWNL